jgi:hypothetical protein
MPEIDFELAHFFAWARARAYREFDRRMQEDPTLDPNWTLSEIMQELLNQYRQSLVEKGRENAEHAE